MKQFFYIIAAALLLTAAGCSAPASSGTTSDNRSGYTVDRFERGEYLAELSCPADTIEYGSTVEISLKLEYPEDERYILLPPAVKSNERYSNTVITEVIEGAPIMSGNGRASSEIIFRLEAWLPGEIVFPPLTVNFTEEVTTDEVVIAVASAFDATDEERVLAPLYIPESDNSSSKKIPIIIAAAIVLAAAVTGIILLLRRRKRFSALPTPGLTRNEILDNFKKNYIDPSGPVDLRQAFNALSPLIDSDTRLEFGAVIDEARFSKNGIAYDDGIRVLHKLYYQFIEEKNGGDADEL